MENPDIAASFEKLGPLQEKLSAVQEQLDQANSDWENALETLDEFEESKRSRFSKNRKS